MECSEVLCAAPTAVRPILVLGIGNLLLRDEGVGVHVAQALNGTHACLPPEVDVVDGATAGFGLVEILAGRRKVIVIDAVRAPAEAGSIVRLTIDDLVAADTAPLSLHEAGLLEALAAARRLGIAPQEIVILGVRPDIVDYGLELSPMVAALVPRIVELVLEELGVAAAVEVP